MQAFVGCPALADVLFDVDVMERSVKFVNTNNYGTVNVSDVVEILKTHKISVEEVETIARGMSDKEVNVVFCSPDSIVF
jgi:uncharacterized metal-binding protein